MSELEVTQTTETNEKNSIDLSERVASTVARSSTTNISANGSYNAIVWNASGSASSSVTNSTTNSNELITKRLNEITKKQAETIRKKTTVTTRVTKTSRDRVTSRHAIENKTDTPLVLGLYSVGHKIETQVQTLGASLVWQSRIDNPGKLLARSQVLDLLVTPAKIGLQKISRSVKVTVSCRTINLNVSIAAALESTFEAEFPNESAIRATEHYRICRRMVEELISIGEVATHFEMPDNTFEYGNGLPIKKIKLHKPKIIYASHRLLIPRAGGSSGWIDDATDRVVMSNALKDPTKTSKGQEFNLNAGAFVNGIKIPYVNPEYDSTFELHFVFEFSTPQLLSMGDAFNTDDPFLEKKKAQNAANYLEQQLNNDLKRERAGLHFEERKLILANKIAKLVQGVPGKALKGEIVQLLYLRVRDIFDLDQLFYDVNTFEYEAGFAIGIGAEKHHSVYNIHSKMENAKRIPVGSSLNWEHQLDGDFQRDMFLNAPFAWVCLPVRAGKEQDAQAFLDEFGLFVGKEKRFDELQIELKVLRAFERLFPIPPDVKEYSGDSTLGKNTLVQEFLKWAGYVKSTEPEPIKLDLPSKPSEGWFCGLYTSLFGQCKNKPDVDSNTVPELKDKSTKEEIEKQVERFVKERYINASHLYVVTSAFDTFVPIEGVAIEKVVLS